jgi:hypothetical protein
MARLRFSIAGLMGVVLALSIGIVSLRSASDAWAAFILLMTLGILTLSVLGIVYRTGSRRASWVGFALLGWGYMVLTSSSWWDRQVDRPELATSMLLDRLCPYIQTERAPGVTSSTLARALGLNADARNQRILTKLDDPVSMSFANETPLKDILMYIKSATTGPNDNGIPIYVDPAGLQKVEKTMTSRVALDIEGVPLRTTLQVLLRQLGLTYDVRDGLLTITAASDTSESFRRIGHCYWALLMACLGSVAGRRFYNTRDEAADRSVPGES